MKQAHRFSALGQPYAGLTRMTAGGPVWTGDVVTLPHKVAEPLTWRKPSWVFVNSMSDLFHENIVDNFIIDVYAVMVAAWWHTFQVLTKRPARRFLHLTDSAFRLAVGERAAAHINKLRGPLSWAATVNLAAWHAGEVPNIWEGVSVEDQHAFDTRLGALLLAPAAVRFLSCEPLLEPLSIAPWLSRRSDGRGVDWVIIGGESGVGARPCQIDWIIDLVRDCQRADTAVFVKQLGAKPDGWCVNRLLDTHFDYAAHFCDISEASEGSHCGNRCAFLVDKKGGDPAEWPIECRVRQFPKVATDQQRPVA